MKNQKGFTLLEILAVIMIMGILEILAGIMIMGILAAIWLMAHRKMKNE